MHAPKFSKSMLKNNASVLEFNVHLTTSNAIIYYGRQTPSNQWVDHGAFPFLVQTQEQTCGC